MRASRLRTRAEAGAESAFFDSAGGASVRSAIAFLTVSVNGMPVGQRAGQLRRPSIRVAAAASTSTVTRMRATTRTWWGFMDLDSEKGSVCTQTGTADGGEALLPAQREQLDQDEVAGDRRTGLPDQVGGGEHRAAGGEDVVDHEHPRAGRQRVDVHLEHGRAV